jgi:hypothetical protein
MRTATGLAMRGCTLATLGTLVLVHAGVAGRQMPNVHRSTTELTAIPDWLYAPFSVRLTVPTGIKLELMTMTIVSSDQRREAALIGVLRNRGRAVRGALVSLSYLGADGESILRSVPNAAYVSEVPVDGLLPFRLPLSVGAAVPRGVTAFEMLLEERIDGARHSLHSNIRGDLSISRQRDNAASVVGDLEIRDGEVPLPDNARMLVTLLLHDKSGNLLEVLSGTSTSRSGLNVFRVHFDSFLLLAGRVKKSRVHVEAGS